MSVCKTITVCLLLAAALLSVQATAQALPRREARPLKQSVKPPLPVWSAVDAALAQQLLTDDVGQLAQQAVHSPLPNTEPGRMHLLALFLRAGYRREALRLIRRLPIMRTAEEANAWSSALNALYEHQEWELAAALLDKLPRSTPNWMHVLLDYQLKTETPEALDRWMLSRTSFAPAYWQGCRLFVWGRFGQTKRVLNPLADEVRRHPADFARAEEYLQAARQVDKAPVEWLAEVCRPTLAMQSFLLGQQIAPRSQTAAVTFFERSLATPFTRQDARWYYNQRPGMAVSALPPHEIAEMQMRDWTKMALAESYQRLGQADKAQPLLEAVSAHNPDGLPSGYGQLAGQIQAGSGARVIENRIRTAEAQPENQNSPDYWKTRADYYAGRKENAQALAAYEKALELIKQDPQSNDFARSMVMTAAAHFIFVTEGVPQAVQWEYRQLDTADPGSEYARSIVREILWHQDTTTHYIRPDDERLWTFLNAQKLWRWGHNQTGQLLEEMAKATPTAEQDAFWNRAERLAARADPSRPFAMGDALWHLHEWERLIPTLTSVFPRLTDEVEQRFACLYLFQAYLETNRWREAKEMLENGRRGLPLAYDLSPETLQQTAEAAARAGALPEAFDLWKRAVNIDRRVCGNLPALTQLGLGERLRAYYRTLQSQEPQCELPEPVAAFLK